MMRPEAQTAPLKTHHYVIIAGMLAIGLMILFAASAYQQTTEMMVVVENRDERPVTGLTITIVGEEETNVLWQGDLPIDEIATVQGEAPIAGALQIRAVREGRTFTLGPAGYIAPDLDTHHRFVLRADRSIDHMVATGIIPEWRHFQTYEGPHERPPVLAGRTK